MKKKITWVFILVLFITNSFSAVGQPLEIIPRMFDRWDFNDTPNFQQLKPPDRNLLDLSKKGVGGVAFSNIAEPLGIAAGKPLSLRYNPLKTNGNRLEVLVGDMVINSGLYDWELVPLTRYVASNSWACVSLLGFPNNSDSLALFQNAFDKCNLKVDDINTLREIIILRREPGVIDIADVFFQALDRDDSDDETFETTLITAIMESEYIKSIKKNDPNNYETILEQTLKNTYEYIEKLFNLSENDQKAFIEFNLNVMWASYNPGMGNTLMGINLLLLDAMFVAGGQNIPYIVDLTKDIPTLRGYNNIPFNPASPSSELLQILIGEKWKWGTYIFSDDGLPIHYWINGNKINFSGFPYYQFMRIKTDGNFEYIPEINNYMRLYYSEIKALNPVIFNAAERWCHWSALFRAVEKNNKVSWNSYLNSINTAYPYNPDSPEQTRYPVPSYKTPRLWMH